MHNLREICDVMIGDAFHELMNTDVRLEYKKVEDGLAEYGELEREGFYIEIDPVLEAQSIDVLQGALAHEMAHIVLDCKRRVRLTLWGSLLEAIAYKSSKRFRTLDERNTDLEVIMRGYGRQLLALMEYSEEHWDYDRDEGLSRREIKAILGSHKKKKK